MIKFFKNIIFLLIATLSVSAQNADSLSLLLKKTENTEKLKIYFQLAQIYSSTSPELCVTYAINGLKSAEKQGDIYYQGVFCGVLGYAYSMISRTDSAVYFSLKSIDLLEQSDSTTALVNSYSTMSIIHYKSGNYTKALEYNFKALNLNSQNYNARKEAVILLNIGVIYQARSDLDSAVIYFSKALKIFESRSDSLNIYKTLQNIGLLYITLNDWEKSLQYLKQSLNYIDKEKYKYHLSTIYINIGICLKNLKNYDSSLVYFQKAIDISKETGNNYSLAYAYNNTGKLYETLENFDKAIKFYELSYNLRKNTGDQSEIARSLLNLGSVYGKSGNKTKAFECFSRACTIAQNIGAKKLMLDCYSDLANYYADNQYFQKAFEYQKKYDAIKDSIFNDEKLSIITEFQTKYETEKKEQQILILNQQNNIKDIELKKEHYLRMLLFLTIIFLLSISALLYNKFQHKKKANILLQKQKKQIQLLYDELNASNDNLKKLNEQLSEANATKDKFFSIISHDLRNPISVMYATTNLLVKNFKKFEPSKIETYLRNMNLATGNILNLLENMLNWANLQSGKLTLQKQHANFSDIITKNIILFECNARKKHIKIISKYDKNISADIDINMIDTVIRNLISNAIKFSFPDSKIFVSAEKKDDFIIFSVKDSGTGISKENLSKIFNSTSTQRGTQNEKGTGLGLILCKEFIEKHGGNISVKSQENQGTEFYFKIPAK